MKSAISAPRTREATQCLQPLLCSMMTRTQLAALCCLYLAYLTGAEKLSQQNSLGYNYHPPNPNPPTYFSPHPSPSDDVYIPPTNHIFHPQHSFAQRPKPSNQKPSYEEKPMPFAYGYGVSDSYQGLEFGHSTNSDGKVTTGNYRVLLPDKRTQIVNYRVDESGYHADVTYEGEAQPASTVQENNGPVVQSTDSEHNAARPTYSGGSVAHPAFGDHNAAQPKYDHHRASQPTFSELSVARPSYGQSDVAHSSFASDSHQSLFVHQSADPSHRQISLGPLAGHSQSPGMFGINEHGFVQPELIHHGSTGLGGIQHRYGEPRFMNHFSRGITAQNPTFSLQSSYIEPNVSPPNTLYRADF